MLLSYWQCFWCSSFPIVLSFWIYVQLVNHMGIEQIWMMVKKLLILSVETILLMKRRATGVRGVATASAVMNRYESKWSTWTGIRTYGPHEQVSEQMALMNRYQNKWHPHQQVWEQMQTSCVSIKVQKEDVYLPPEIEFLLLTANTW